MRESLDNEALRQSKKMSDTLNKTAILFLEQRGKKFEDMMTVGLKFIADELELSRISVWHNFYGSNGLHTSQLYRWERASGGTTVPRAGLEDIYFADIAPRWERILAAGEFINSPARLLPEEKLLKSFDVVSIFVAPVFIENSFWGFVLFEDNRVERYFDDDSADMLKSAALLCANTVILNEKTQNLNNATAILRRREKMLNALNEMAVMLLSHENEINDDVMHRGLRPITAAAGVDRVAVYKFTEGSEFDQIYLWYGKTIPLEDAARALPGKSPVLRWNDTLKKGDCINANVSEMDRESAELLSQFGVKSIYFVPIFMHGKYWGTITLEDHTNYRYFDEDSLDLLRSAAHLCAGAVMRAEMERELTEKNKLLAALNSISATMLRSDSRNLVNALYESMSFLAKVVSVDRVHIWKNSVIGGELCCTKLYEWLESAASQRSNGLTINISYRKNIPGWEETLSQGKLINGIVREMSEAEQALLAHQHIVSILAAPVFYNNQFWGLVGFNDCHRERIFSQNEETILRSAAQVWADAVMRAEMEQDLAMAEAANRTKSVFLANMSHEIRTPMNSIIGFAELAQDDDISPKTGDYLRKISESAAWLLNIINDILDISKIESGRMELEKIPFDLAEIFSHCRSLIIPMTEEKGIELFCYAEPSVGKMLLGDPVRLRQALMNLLSNAVKFTNAGTVKLLAAVTESGDDCVAIRFEVKDTGIGMSPDQLTRIFEPFMQADSSVTRKFGGTGLGLPIAKNIIGLMGGTLNIESTPGVGSKFSFELKFDLVGDRTCPRKIILGNAEKPNFNGEILVCEDNSLNQQVICDHLGRVGLRVVMANNGREGVDIAAKRAQNGEKPFDLILMDIHMPVMDGLEAAAKIGELKIKTPVIALTANIMSNDIDLYKASNMIDYLGKPFTSQELWKCLMEYLPVESFSSIDRNLQSAKEDKLQKQLAVCFVKSNRNTYDAIIRAVDGGDIKTAHRLAHTLKSSAAQIGERRLQEAAAAAEAMLSGGENKLTAERAGVLKSELNSVIDKLSPLLAENLSPGRAEITDAGTARKIYEKLEPLLGEGNPACLDFLDNVRAIPGAKDLAFQMEEFNFRQAHAELLRLMKDSPIDSPDKCGENNENW